MKPLFSRLLGLALFSAFLLIFPQQGKACGLDEILLGVCPVTPVEQELYSRDNPNVHVFTRAYSWVNFEDFKDARNAPIVLNVCVFRGPATPVQTVENYVAVDYSAGPQLSEFTRIVQKIEAAANKWTEFRLNGKVSRLQFVFKDENGAYRECERFPQSHILISINRNKVNFSEVGFKSLSIARATTPRRSTMSLEPGVLPREIIHEFGHALGFLHEMAHVDWQECAKAFDIDAFMKNRPNSKVPESTIKNNIVNAAAQYKDAATLPNERFDRDSIMVYKIRARSFRAEDLDNLAPSDCAFRRWPKALSDGDKRGFLALYGRDE